MILCWNVGSSLQKLLSLLNNLWVRDTAESGISGKRSAYDRGLGLRFRMADWYDRH